MDIFWAAFGGGAAGSVVTLVAVLASEYLKGRLSEPKLVVSISLGYMQGGEVWTLKDSRPEDIYFDIKNTRTRPVTVINYGFMYESGDRPKAIIRPPQWIQLPHEITAGKSLMAWINTEVYLQSLIEDSRTPKDIKYAYVVTSDGREFRGKLAKDTIGTLTTSLEAYKAKNAVDGE